MAMIRVVPLVLAACAVLVTGGPDRAFAATVPEAQALLEASDYPKAEALARELLAVADSAQGPESLASADAIDVLVRSLWQQRKTKNEETVALAERAVRIRTHEQPRSAKLAGSLYALAVITRINGEYARALALYEDALEIQEAVLPPNDPSVGDTLNGMGTTLHRLGRLEDAERIYRRSIATQSAAHGEDDEKVALVLGNLANVYRDQDRLDEAIQLQEKALAIRERVFGPESREIIANVSGLAVALTSADDRPRARPLFERELALATKHYGENSTVTAQGHQHLAVICELLGDYPAALEHAERAEAIDRGTMGTRHADYGSDLNTLASIRAAMGDLEEARGLYANARAIWSEALGPESPRTAQATANLGRIEHELGNDAVARTLLEEALAVQEAALGKDALEAAFTLSDLCAIALDAGDSAAARASAERALAIRTKHLGAHSPLAAVSMRQLAEVIARTESTAAARDLFARAASTQEKALGPAHPDLAESLAGLAHVLWKQGELDGALDAALRAEKIGRDHLRETARVLPERDALRYDAIRASGSNIALAVTVDRPSPESVRKSWDALVHSRALVLDEVAQRHRTVVGSNDPEVARLATDLDSARRELAHRILRGVSEGGASDSARIEAARRTRDQAERNLAERSQSYRERGAAERIGLDEVLAALPPHSAIVSFAAFVHPDRGAEYLAFVNRVGSDGPLVVGLGSRAAIDSAVARWNRAVRASARASRADEARAARIAHEEGGRLREMVWTPIERRVGHLRRFFLVPDAALHLTSFAALPLDDARFLIDQIETVHYAAAERDLVLAPATRDPAASDRILVVGGPRFDDSIRLAATTTSAPASAVPVRLPGTFALRGALTDCPEFAALRFEPLPGSSREAQVVGSIWKNAKRGPLVRLEASNATEARVKSSAPGCCVLHFATHSFVLDTICRPSKRSPAWTSSGAAGLAAASLLLESGLALAGANHRNAAQEGDEDGILTAEEIAGLDLSDAQWAVLSSCESGAGESVAGEGVFGLRRAFRVAGARTVIMTLWPVDDESARAWIRDLYEERLRHGRSTDEAVCAASRAQLATLRKRGQIAHPFLWGNFVAAGDWR